MKSNRNVWRSNSTKCESYFKTLKSSYIAPAQLDGSSLQPKENSIKSNMNNRMKNISNKPFEDLSKIKSLRQVDFLPEIVTRDDMKKSLLELEKKYSMTSEKFYSDYKQGKAEDNFDSLKWAILYELWMQKYLMQV